MENKELKELVLMNRKWKFTKFASEKDFAENNPYEVNEVDHNCLLNEGINELFTLICSASGSKFDHDTAYIGVGDEGDTAADPAQTGLLAITNKLYKAMDESYPTYGTAQKATWRATFGADDANYAWKEFTVANGNSNASKNLNRLVSLQGTKTSGQVWQISLEISIA